MVIDNALMKKTNIQLVEINNMTLPQWNMYVHVYIYSLIIYIFINACCFLYYNNSDNDNDNFIYKRLKKHERQVLELGIFPPNPPPSTSRPLPPAKTIGPSSLPSSTNPSPHNYIQSTTKQCR